MTMRPSSLSGQQTLDRGQNVTHGELIGKRRGVWADHLQHSAFDGCWRCFLKCELCQGAKCFPAPLMSGQRRGNWLMCGRAQPKWSQTRLLPSILHVVDLNLLHSKRL